MILGNFNNLTLIIFIFIFLIGIFIFWGIYKNDKIRLILLILISFVFLIINIFEIKGGYKNDIKNIDGGKIVFAIDISKSMLTQDIKIKNNFISRQDTIKQFISNFLLKNTNNLYGLIVFAGEAIEILPFTNDIGIFKTILLGINNKNVSKYGTNLNSVFYSLNTYFSGEKNGGLAIIFTDGGDENISLSEDLIFKLKQLKVKILIIGIGTKFGGKIPEGIDLFGRKIYKKYQGKYVISKLNNNVLKNFSSNYNIDYLKLNNIFDLKKIDNYLLDNLELISLKKDINLRVDYTRFFIFISFIFFIGFLICNIILGKK